MQHATTSSPPNLNVLIVDDDEDQAESLAFCLALEGRNVRYATNGDQAFALLADFTPDVALLDIVMPKPDGRTLARALRQRFDARIVLVAVTGALTPRDTANAFDHQLAKPIEAEALERVFAGLTAAAR